MAWIRRGEEKEKEERCLIEDLKRHAQIGVARVSSPQLDLNRRREQETPTLLVLRYSGANFPLSQE